MKDSMKARVAEPKILAVALLLLAALFSPSQLMAQGRGQSPICALETGKAKGVCNAAVAANCNSDQPVSEVVCETLTEEYESATGGEPPAWICPCFTPADIDARVAEIEGFTPILEFRCSDTDPNFTIWGQIFSVTSLGPGGSFGGFITGEVAWKDVPQTDERYCVRITGGEANDLTFGQAQTCHQNILASDTWLRCP